MRRILLSLFLLLLSFFARPARVEHWGRMIWGSVGAGPWMGKRGALVVVLGDLAARCIQPGPRSSGTGGCRGIFTFVNLVNEMKRCRILHGSFFCLALMAMTTPSNANLIVNGDFESTSLHKSVPDGWEVYGFNVQSPLAFRNNSVVPPASGSWALDLGPAGIDDENGGTISQTFSVSAPGNYVFSFDYTNELHHASFVADFSWFLTGVVTDSATLTGIGGGYQAFSNSYVVSSSGDITVGFHDIVSGQQYDAVIDNVSFVPAVVVPEPSSGPMLLIGIIGLGFRRRRPNPPGV